MEEKKITTMLQAVDAITKNAKDSDIGEDFVKKMKPALDVISEKLGTTDTQSLMMVRFINHAFDKNIEINDVFDDTDCPTSRKLELMNDVEWLVDNRYLMRIKDHWGEKSYKIPDSVLNCFQHNTKFVHKEYEKVSARVLFFVLEELFESRDNEEISFAHLVREVHQLFDVNKELEFVRKVRSFALNEEDEMLLIVFCHLFVNNADDNIVWNDLKFLYDNHRTSMGARSELYDDCHILITTKMVEHTNDGGFVNKESFKLTEQAKRNILGELDIRSVQNGKSASDVIKHKDIKAKELFFPSSVESQVNELKDLLQEKHYKEICQRMKKKGFHSGFTCLFYGTPGTGKTETVYQLAKLTGRDVMVVDIPQVRSMWVGESEKNVKGIFTRYAGLVKDARRTPILLFNEADAIIGKRTMNHDSAADKMENTMQNIILQEMENLNGILIATTNLQSNMDRAFERRFLYKIQFDRPGTLSRAKIWHTMIPELDNSTVNSLAQKYDFSGGQIENIARHYTIETILKGTETVTLQTLDAFCQQESIKKEKHSIGFHQVG